MAEVRIHGIVSGIVQGVGFRYFAQREAGRLGLSGWVRNLSSGDVDFEVQGKESVVDEFIESIKTKHLWARIDGIEMKKLPCVQSDSIFKIKF